MHNVQNGNVYSHMTQRLLQVSLHNLLCRVICLHHGMSTFQPIHAKRAIRGRQAHYHEIQTLLIVLPKRDALIHLESMPHEHETRHDDTRQRYPQGAVVPENGDQTGKEDHDMLLAAFGPMYEASNAFRRFEVSRAEGDEFYVSWKQKQGTADRCAPWHQEQDAEYVDQDRYECQGAVLDS